LAIGDLAFAIGDLFLEGMVDVEVTFLVAFFSLTTFGDTLDLVFFLADPCSTAGEEVPPSPNSSPDDSARHYSDCAHQTKGTILPFPLAAFFLVFGLICLSG